MTPTAVDARPFTVETGEKMATHVVAQRSVKMSLMAAAAGQLPTEVCEKLVAL
jgi:hypothetical protein